MAYCFPHNDNSPLGVWEGAPSAAKHNHLSPESGTRGKGEQSCIVRKPEGWTKHSRAPENSCGKRFLHSCLWLFNPIFSQTALGEESYSCALLFHYGEKHKEKNKSNVRCAQEKALFGLPSLFPLGCYLLRLKCSLGSKGCCHQGKILISLTFLFWSSYLLTCSCDDLGAWWE